MQTEYVESAQTKCLEDYPGSPPCFVLPSLRIDATRWRRLPSDSNRSKDATMSLKSGIIGASSFGRRFTSLFKMHPLVGENCIAELLDEA